MLSRNSVCFWIAALTLGSVVAAPADATVRTAVYTWAPATGPVAGYRLYASVDGHAETLLANVGQPNAVITVDPGASLVVSVAAFDASGVTGPRSAASAPLRLCPGDFDGDEQIETSDLDNTRSCLLQVASGDCAGGDMDDDGNVALTDYLALEVGADACLAFGPPASCLGDMNGDGAISMFDVFAARDCVLLPATGACANADWDGNGAITMYDLSLAKVQVGTQACSN